MCVRVSGANNQHAYVTGKRNSSTLGSVAAAPGEGSPTNDRRHNLYDDCRELECLDRSSHPHTMPSLSHTHVSSRCSLFSIVSGRCASLHVSLLLSQCTLLHNVTIHPLVRGRAGLHAACNSAEIAPSKRHRKPAKRGKYINIRICQSVPSEHAHFLIQHGRHEPEQALRGGCGPRWQACSHPGTQHSHSDAHVSHIRVSRPFLAACDRTS